MALTHASLQPLLDQLQGEGTMVSCYADLSIIPGVPRWPGLFKAKTGALKELFTGDQRSWQQIEQNLAAIGRALEAPEARNARSMAVFSALQRGFFQCYPLDVPVENELVVHEAPYLVPLLMALHRQREYLVVLTDTHRGRLYTATVGNVRLLQEIQEEVPSRQHSVGERWGKEQATIARYRENCILHYHKDLVGLIEKAWAEQPFQGILLFGEHEILEHLRKRLPARLAAQVVHEGAHAWTDKPLAVAEAVRATLADVEQVRDKRLLEGLEDRLSQGHAIAAGPGAVIEALQSGRVGCRGYGYLVLGPDPREAVARCTACRSLFVQMPSSCPRCQAPCVDANLWEEILLLAWRHDIAVHGVKSNESLARCDGIAAVLTTSTEAHTTTAHQGVLV